MNRAGYLIRSLSLALLAFPIGASEASKLLEHLKSQRGPQRAAALMEIAQLKDAALAKQAIQAQLIYKDWSSAEITICSDLLSLQDMSVSIAALKESHNGYVRAAIYELSRRPPERLEPIIKDMLSGDESMVKLAQDILGKVLAQRGKTPAHLALILLQFQSDKEYVRTSAVNALGYLPTVDQAVLRHIHKDQSPKVRIVLADVVARHLSRVIREKNTEDASWLHEIFQALGKDPEDSVRTATFKEMEDIWYTIYTSDRAKEYIEFTIAALNDKSPSVRSRALGIFRRTSEPRIIPIIEKLADDPEGLVAYMALSVAKNMKIPSLPDLAFKACSLPHPQTRESALRILKECNDTRLIPVATRLLNDPDSQVRSMARNVLDDTQIGVDSGIMILARVANVKGEQLQAILVRLAQLDDKERLNEISRLYAQMTAEQRIEFMEWCGRSPNLASNAGDFLLLRAEDKDPEIAVLAFKALQEFNRRGGMLGVAIAFERSTDPNEKVAEQAKYLLQTTARRDQRYQAFKRFAMRNYEVSQESRELERVIVPQAPGDFANFLAALKAAPNTEKPKYFQALAEIDEPRAVDALREATRSPDRLTRWAALDALVKHGDQSDAVLDHALARLLEMATNRWSSYQWPIIDQRLLARLDTFKKIADPQAVAALRTEIERRISLINSLEITR